MTTDESIYSIPILMYHEITDLDKISSLSKRIQHTYIVSTDRFESQIKFLSDNGYIPISLKQLVDYINGNLEDLPARSVIITFDDGFRGNYEYAFPILEKYEMTATIFIVVNKIDKEFMLTWKQLRAMQSRGMSIQSHTMNHLLLSKLDLKATREELFRSKEIIEQRIGEKVSFISLPNGDYNRYYEAVASDAGYLGGCSSMFGYNNKNTNPFFLKRIAIKGYFNINQFKDILDDKSFFTRRLKCKSIIKLGIARIISKGVYDKVYNSFYGIGND